MDHESLNWFRFTKCLADVGNTVLRRYLYFHASTCSLSGYHDIWQQNVSDQCQSGDLNVLWTSLNQHSLALGVTNQQIFQPLLTKWKGSITGSPMEIRKQLSALEIWEKDLGDTIGTNAIQPNTLNKMSSEIQNLVTEHCLLLTAVKTWTKDFINVCHMNQSDLLHLIEQHNERTTSLLSTFLQKLDVIVKQGSDDLKDALQTCQQDDGNSSSELKTNIHTCFISWKLNIDKLIDSWVTNIPNCFNQNILQNLLICMRNDLPGVHNTCQVNINICSTWHTDLQNELAELNHQLQQVGQSTQDQLDLARKLHEKLKIFPSVSERQIKEFFDSKETYLKKLLKRRILTEPQWPLMFPSQGSINLETFDITLSSTLLRNICSVYPPELGWSGKTLDTDHSVGADLMRLKQYRNNYVGHIPHFALSDSDFEEIWGILETILHRLSVPLGNEFGQEIQQKLIELRTCSFDDHAEMKLQLELLNWYKSDLGQMPEKLENVYQLLEEKLHNMSNQNVVVLSELQHLTTQIGNMNEDQKANGSSKQNQRIELTKGVIKEHNEKKKNIHVSTRAYQHAREILLKHRHLVLRGRPGDGKTHTALSLIANLMETYQEMQPVKVDKPSQWEKFVDMKQPLIVFMDNVLGKYGVSETDLIKWEHLSELIYPNIDDSFIFVIVCLRDQIALKIKRYIHRNKALSWMFDSNVINISDENNCLTKQEKEEILMKYTMKHSKTPSSFEVDNIVNIENQIGFPENCRIWSCHSHLILEDVCVNNMFLVEEIRDISSKVHQDYLFLVLLMLSGGSLSLDKNTEELISKIKKISKLCGVREKLTICQFKGIGDSLCSTFVEYNTETKKFSFHHDTVELVVFLCFGSDFPQITLEMCSLQALTKMCCVRNKDNSSNDSFLKFKILIEDDAYFTVIVGRFSNALESRKRELFQCVAEALVWQSTRFLDYFLKTLSSSDQVVTFLSMQDLDEQSLLVYFIYADNATVVRGIVDKIAQFNIRNHDLVSRQILLATVNACLADKEHIFNYLVDHQDKVDDFVLFAAASTGNVSIMDALLRNGGNVNATISDKLSKDLANTIKHCVSFPKTESYHHDINLFQVACSKGRVDMVKYLMSSYPKLIQNTSSLGYTSAHFAARSENVEIMKLLSAEELVTWKTIDGITVLHTAAANGNLKMVKFLAETFPQMAYETDNDGWTVLHSSGLGGNILVLKTLLEKGLDIMARTDTDVNILHISAEKSHLLMVKYLIETYPFLITQTDNKGTTAVHCAAHGGNLQILMALLENGLDITAINNDGENVLHFSAKTNHVLMIKYLIQSYPDLHKQRQKNGRTPLHYAAGLGDVSMIEALLHAGSDILARDNTGVNVLHLAALDKNISTVDYLLKTYPHLEQDSNNDGLTALHICAQGGSIRVMELLLQVGSDIKARSRCGNNALHIAALNNKLEMVNYLIMKCPQLIHMTENQGLTALHVAAEVGDVQVMESLINAGSDITASNREGTNVFHMAVRKDRLSAVRYLLYKFPKLVQLNNTKFGYTALHYACETSGVTMFKVLIQAGVNIKARTRNGKDVLQLAVEHNNLSVVNYLTEYLSLK